MAVNPERVFSYSSIAECKKSMVRDWNSLDLMSAQKFTELPSVIKLPSEEDSKMSITGTKEKEV